ncbi:MAG: Hpt domain-containing protein [Paucibacter sp.]|nr:Hpt domain-containing protein [Roseateles sp.]
MPLPPTTIAAALDADALARLRELDPESRSGLLVRVVNAYLASLDRLVPELDQARGANADAEVIRHVAHTLKSSSASVGALQVSRRCAEIETLARERQLERIEPLIDQLLDELAQARLALTNLLGA